MNFGVPFRNGVVPEFFKATGIHLRQNGNAFWTGLTSEQASVVKTWLEAQGSRVYLKDFFDCSIALGERSVDLLETPLGALFTAAKYQQNEDAIAELVRRVRKTIDEMQTLGGHTLISCPTPRPDKEWDLPTDIAKKVARKVGLDFAELGEWKGDKGQLKGVASDKKWAALEQAGFTVNPAVIRSGKAVLLIDDIYQSGATLNFLRSALTKAGVARASAISLVKAQRDTDNQ